MRPTRACLHSSGAENYGDGVDHGCEAFIGFFIACRDASKHLDLAEEVFNEVAPLVLFRVMRRVSGGSLAHRNHGLGAEAIRRLIDVGLGSVGTIPGKTPQAASDKPDSEGKAAGAGPTALTPMSPEQVPERLAVKGEQTTREVRWTPRVVETTPSSAPAPSTTTPEAQPVTDPVEDNSPYQMPEDLKAFNEYWVQAEHGLGRQLSYEEVIVLFNQDRQASKTLSDYED